MNPNEINKFIFRLSSLTAIVSLLTACSLFRNSDNPTLSAVPATMTALAAQVPGIDLTVQATHSNLTPGAPGAGNNSSCETFNSYDSGALSVIFRYGQRTTGNIRGKIGHNYKIYDVNGNEIDSSYNYYLEDSPALNVGDKLCDQNPG